MTPVFRLSFLVALFAVAVVPAPAQTSRKPVFDSMYTKLAAGWTVDLRFAATQKEDEAAGRDTPRVHKGFGGYSFDGLWVR